MSVGLFGGSGAEEFWVYRFCLVSDIVENAPLSGFPDSGCPVCLVRMQGARKTLPCNEFGVQWKIAWPVGTIVSPCTFIQGALWLLCNAWSHTL